MAYGYYSGYTLVACHFNTNSTVRDAYVLYMFCSKKVVHSRSFLHIFYILFSHTHSLSHFPSFFWHYTFFSTKLHFLVCLAWIWVKDVNKEKKGEHYVVTYIQSTGIAESTQIPGSWSTQLFYT